MRKLHCRWQALLGMMSLVLVLSLALFVDTFSIVSHAESQGKVTAQSAKIRKEANTSSDVLGSASSGDEISIISQTTGSDGYTWFYIYVDANTKGYIRADLAEVTDGTTPTTSSNTSTSTQTSTQTTTQTTTTVVNETPVAVTEVEPISANVTGGSAVRVRSNASTTSSIVTTAQNGLALTVTGTATGTDGNTWYQVNFIANGTQVVGFIRNDYVVLAGELVVPSTDTVPEETEQVEEPAAEETKDWDTQLDNDKWYLVDNAASKRYVIDDMFNAVEANKTLYEDAQAKIKSQKVTVIILVILLVVALGAIALLIFRIKDMLDEAYFEEVEKETYRKRSNSGSSSSSSNRKIMQTVGDEQATRKGANQAPAGARPAQRPAGQAPAGARPSQRPTGQAPAGARPAQRPTGQAPAGARPAQRPAGQAPAGSRPVQRPASQAPEGSRPVQRPAGQIPDEARTVSQAAQAPRQLQQPANANNNPGWKSKNFMADDDEFEFEFLNWEGDEE